MHYTHLQTPIGKLRLRANDLRLAGVDHVCQQASEGDDWCEDIEKKHPILKLAAEELESFFVGEIENFTTPLAPFNSLGTDFQAEVWQALLSIPYGQTQSYADIAASIGKPKAVRAVGAANGKNPLSIFVPCHRVIGKSGKLTGYAGGIEQKKLLLELEQRVFKLL